VNDDKLGYIRITQFGEHTTEELREALEKLDEAGMQGLVIDLRNNPGGLLDQAVKVCDIFLPSNQLIVSTEGRDGPLKGEKYKATGKDEYPDLHIVILVNKWSASASEIVAGCLQDLKRAYVIGETTFGKGSVQSIMPLANGNALRLTTAKYYTPSHKVIHERGITPNSEVPMTAEEEEALYLRRLLGGFESLNEEQKAKLDSVRDVQLDRAFDHLKSQIIYEDRADKLQSGTAETTAQRNN
jgi:carboxyl-terminal processing protease